MIPDHQGRSFDGMQGGSDSDAALRQGSSITFFQKGVKWLIPSEKKRVQGRILPARDHTLSKNDSAWAASALPYRDRTSGLLDDLTKTQKFNPFYAAFLGYKFFGRTQASIVSPQTLKALGGGVTVADIADPIMDCRNFARNSSDPDIKKLSEKVGNDKRARAVIPYFQGMALLNMYCAEDRGEWDTRIVTVAGGSIEDLKRKLSWQTPASQAKPWDPNWPEYVYGDVTDLANGLLASLIPISVGVTTPTGFSFSNRDYVLDGSKRQPVEAAELPKRYDLLSSATLRIDTYQSLVEFLVDDGTIPYHIIEAACSSMATVPKQVKQNTTVSSPAPQSTPPPGGVPGLLGGPAAPASEDSTKYWINGPTGVSQTNAKGVQSMVNLGGDPQLLAYDQTGGWKTATELGFSKPTPTAPVAFAPPVAPTAPAAPMPPAAPVPPSAPTPVKTLRKFWMALPNGVTKEASEDQVQQSVENGLNFQIMNYDQSGGWVKPDVLGFKKDEIDMTPTPLAAPVTPTAPVAPVAPTPPAPVAPTASAETSDNLSTDEAAELRGLQDRATAPGAAGTPGGPLSHPETMRLIELTKRAQGAA